jgi:hypothetical protein
MNIWLFNGNTGYKGPYESVEYHNKTQSMLHDHTSSTRSMWVYVAWHSLMTLE